MRDSDRGPGGAEGSPEAAASAREWCGGVRSPSLSDGDRGVESYEIKFLLDGAAALAVEERVRSVLRPDPHGDPRLDGAYRITSLYCETPALDVFHKRGSYGRRKFRVRRYGESEAVFLERKTVRESRVRKRRTAVGVGDLSRLSGAGPAAAAWDGDWYLRQIVQRGLRPVCRIAYQRQAFFGLLEGYPVRVTFDRGIAGALVPGWEFRAATPERALLDGLVVCECKFAVALPAALKAVIQEFGLTARGLSKYRRCIEAFGLARQEGSGEHA
jgi:hypothetical protein